MKRIYLYALMALSLQLATGCNPDETSVIETVNTEEGDSVNAEIKKLQTELRQKDSAINQSIRMFNEIEENLSAIANKQGVINLNAKDPELAEGERSKIIQEITSINTLLQENKEKVNILRSKL